MLTAPTIFKDNIIDQDILFQRISDITSLVNTVSDTAELLEVSLEYILEIFKAKRGSIFILNSRKNELDLKTAIGMQTAEQKNLVKRLGEGIVGKVAELKKPIVVEDIREDQRFQNLKSQNNYRTHSFICAPLLIKDNLIGVINVADKETGHRFNKGELQLLDFLATQIAINYSRIKLYQKYKHVVKESISLKSELGKSSAEAYNLKKQIVVQEKYASIGKLAGGIAHEFNNPLDGVIRYTNLSLEHLKDDEVVRGYLLEIKHGLNRMANIVRSLLACSRNTPTGNKKTDINQTIEQVLCGIHSEISHKQITVEKKLNQLPVIIDLGVELIVANLLRNAVDAVSKKGKISIFTEHNHQFLVLKIQDSGCGFDPAIADKIFEPFFTTKDIDKGCGLGLTVVSEIVKTYNGKIDVQSSPNQGAIFTVYLPLLK